MSEENAMPLAEGQTSNIPKVNPFKAVVGLAEIGQSMGVKICLMHKEEDGSYTETCPKVKCYDFLVDSYSSSVEKYDFSIYGFTWKGSTKSPDWDAVNLSILFPN